MGEKPSSDPSLPRQACRLRRPGRPAGRSNERPDGPPNKEDLPAYTSVGRTYIDKNVDLIRGKKWHARTALLI